MNSVCCQVKFLVLLLLLSSVPQYGDAQQGRADNSTKSGQPGRAGELSTIRLQNPQQTVPAARNHGTDLSESAVLLPGEARKNPPQPGLPLTQDGGSKTKLASFQVQQEQGIQTYQDELKTLLTELEANPAISPEVKTVIDQELKLVETHLAQIRKYEADEAAHREAVNSIDQRVAELNKELEEEKNRKAPQVDNSVAVSDLENAIAKLRPTVDQLKKEIGVIDSEIERRTSRINSIRERLATFESRIEKIRADRTAIEAGSSLDLRVKRLLALINERMTIEEDNNLKAEVARYQAESDAKLLELQQSVATQKLSQASDYLKALESKLTEKRQQKAQQAAKEAENKEKEIKKKNPLLVECYQVNTALTKRSEQATARLAELQTKLDQRKSQQDKLRKNFSTTKQRVETVGLSGSVAAMLQKRKSELSNPRTLLLAANEIKDDVDELEQERFEIKQQLESLSRASLFNEIEKTHGNLSRATMDSLKEPVQELIESRTKILQGTEANLGELSETAIKLELSTRVLAKLTAEFSDYIGELILWIRSNDMLFTEWGIDSTDKHVFQPENWSNLGSEILVNMRTHPLLYILTSLLGIMLFAWKPRLRARVDQLGEEAGRGSCSNFSPTIRAFLITFLVSIAWPIVLLMVGVAMKAGVTGESSRLYVAVASGLLATAGFAIPLEVLRRICRLNGLADKHFNWSPFVVAKLRQNLARFFWSGVVLVFALELFREMDSTHQVDFVERIIFVVGMGVLAYFLYNLLNPWSGIFSEYLQEYPNSWARHLTPVWFGAFMILPVWLAGLTIWGYYYTALNLLACGYSTFVFAVVAETARALLARFILIRRRRVHIEAAKRQRELQQEAQKEEGAKEETGAHPVVAAGEQNDVIDENALQARKLVSMAMVLVWAAGLWMIWTDVLPAIRSLDQYTVWYTTNETPTAEASATTTMAMVPQTAPPAGEESASTPPTTSVAESASDGRVTVRDLLFFVLIVLATYAFATNMPSALEMMFLDDLPVDRSFRYAVKSLISYAIVIVGTVFAFNVLSISWSKVQWLATALTFGLAFGLQEIFANFVAGIILMFERPIRIGDLVTVDDFTGTVTRIRTRATTIINWDRKEYIIPNKDFITGRLVNWTLSDEVNRIVITVGIAYGSDVQKAKNAILKICEDHPTLLEDPPPSVTLEAFGDSSLNLVLRTFLPYISNRLVVIDDLHSQIDMAFRQSGIEIAYPTRDINVRRLPTIQTSPDAPS